LSRAGRCRRFQASIKNPAPIDHHYHDIGLGAPGEPLREQAGTASHARHNHLTTHITWQEIEAICPTGLDRSHVVDVHLRWPEATVGRTRWLAV
jgi:hypothetical protein